MALRNSEKRNEILSVSYLLFGDYPYNKVSLADIANKVGINKSLLQHYHSQKSDIVKTLLEELLNCSYLYMDQLSYEYDSLFQKISDFNMLFFRAAESDSRLKQFLISSVSQPELLDWWIEIICGWLSKLCSEDTFNYLQLKMSISFVMGGSMRLYEHMDELGISYKFITENHIRVLMRLLKFDREEYEKVCSTTRQRIDDFSIDDYMEYCKSTITWLS